MSTFCVLRGHCILFDHVTTELDGNVLVEDNQQGNSSADPFPECLMATAVHHRTLRREDLRSPTLSSISSSSLLGNDACAGNASKAATVGKGYGQ